MIASRILSSTSGSSSVGGGRVLGTTYVSFVIDLEGLGGRETY